MNAFNPRVMEWSGEGGVSWWDVGKCQNSPQIRGLERCLGNEYFFESGLIFEFVGIFLVFVMCSELVVESGTWGFP
jgi:hypothetical protein